MSINLLSRLAMVIVAGFASLSTLKLSVDHLQHGEVCPMLGPIPACIFVFLGYFCVVLAAIFITKPFVKRLFYIGWTPVFLLALIGVTAEIALMLGLVKDHTCPPGPIGIPQCFFSLAIALICLASFKIALKTAVSK